MVKQNKSILICLLASLLSSVLCGDLLIVPTPDQSGHVTASIDLGFVLTCQATGNVNEKPKALQWVGPDNQVIKPDPSQSIYTVLEGDVLRLYFDSLKPRDTGAYRCTGIEASIPKESIITLILQSNKLNKKNTKK